MATNLEFFSNAWIQALANGGVATHPEEVWFGGTLKTYIAPKAAGKWGVFKLPAWTPGGSRAAVIGGS